MYEEIQRSLLKDLRSITASLGLKVPRKAWDSLYRQVVGDPLRATALYKDLNMSLAKSTGPSFTFPSGDCVRFGSRDAYLVFAFRQALGMFSRVHALVSKEQEQAQLSDAMARVTEPPKCDLNEDTLVYMREFIEHVIGSAPPRTDAMLFKHGPGAVAECKKKDKVLSKSVPRRIAEYMDSEASWFEKSTTGPDGVTTYKVIPLDFTRNFSLPHQPNDKFRRGAATTRVVTVPKDATKVRIISCEPALGQFSQQGVMDVLYKRMARWCQIDPTSQNRNRQLALRGSCDCVIDTLDCSNASDSVRVAHVQALFPYDWTKILLAFRSDSMKFPNGEKVEITTFAPMGSSLCFPVEMLVFASVVYAAYRHKFVCWSLQEFLEDQTWGIFGDDIICHYRATAMVHMILFNMGIILNELKCCTGDALFRESCGLDAYNGTVITITRPRELNTHAVAAAPMVLHANRLFAAGFRATAQVLANFVPVPVSIGYGPHLACPGLKWPRYGKIRYNVALQRIECLVPYNREIIQDPMPEQGWEALFTWFTNQRQSSSPYISSKKERPSKMWVPADPAFVQEQLARSRQTVHKTQGCAPYAKGTPIGGSSIAHLGATVEEESFPDPSTIEAWRQASLRGCWEQHK